MAKGKELGTFEMKSTTATFLPGPAGSTLVQGNYEGTATGGFGAVAGTATFVGGKSGTFSYCGGSYAEDGDQLSAHGTGTYESIGVHRWRTQGILHLSDGTTLHSEGELDLASRSWTGKVFEWS